MAIPLSSPFDLSARNLGNGTIELRWNYPGNFAASQIVFDVFLSDDPASVFRSCVAANVADLKAMTAEPGRCGTFYFAAVAKQNELLSLPSNIASVNVVAAPVARTESVSVTTATLKPTGLGFPFGVSPLGSIHVQSGNELLRAQIFQLLLTSPGERVDLPDYGTRLRDLVFDPNSEVLAATTEFTIQRALQKYLGNEIRVEQVSVIASDEVLQVNVTYLSTSDLQYQQVRVGVPLPG